MSNEQKSKSVSFKTSKQKEEESSTTSTGSNKTAHLVLKNLPYNIVEDDLVSFLLEHDISCEDITFHRAADGNFKGMAFLRFSNPDDSIGVYNTLSKLSMKGRAIRVEFKRKSQKNAIDYNPPNQESKELLKELTAFAESPSLSELVYPGSLAPLLRSQIHIIASKLGLVHTTQLHGDSQEKCIVIQRPAESPRRENPSSTPSSTPAGVGHGSPHTQSSPLEIKGGSRPRNRRSSSASRKTSSQNNTPSNGQDRASLFTSSVPTSRPMFHLRPRALSDITGRAVPTVTPLRQPKGPDSDGSRGFLGGRGQPNISRVIHPSKSASRSRNNSIVSPPKPPRPTTTPPGSATAPSPPSAHADGSSLPGLLSPPPRHPSSVSPQGSNGMPSGQKAKKRSTLTSTLSPARRLNPANGGSNNGNGNGQPGHQNQGNTAVSSHNSRPQNSSQGSSPPLLSVNEANNNSSSQNMNTTSDAANLAKSPSGTHVYSESIPVLFNAPHNADAPALLASPPQSLVSLSPFASPQGKFLTASSPQQFSSAQPILSTSPFRYPSSSFSTSPTPFNAGLLSSPPVASSFPSSFGIHAQPFAQPH
eukprot:GCRY01000579.1.p1 GENE.GCRY01000579.1~~GCRY01000579.1.p1  ORF type:complete len:589 (-),score=124.39 GCRY01000579.1:149-1915(-)